MTAVLWGVVLLSESLNLYIVIGMVVILGGIVLSNVNRPSREPVSARDSAAA
jgi:drug/metabolite transporter (DMT)-like permease